jgi:hypothetical protein
LIPCPLALADGFMSKRLYSLLRCTPLKAIVLFS